jgi:GT2 family glycosyltransferase
MTAQARVEAIIVAHDPGEVLLDAVASAVVETSAAAVLVIDAGSTDGSIERMSIAHPGVRVLPVENRGFAAGNNRGLEATAAPYVLLLNPDAVLAPGALAALVSAMDAEPRTAIVGPKVVDPGGGIQAGSWGRFPTLAVRTGLALRRLARRLTGRRDVPSLPAQRREVDWVTGAAMLVRREAVADAGPMDEAFFLYYEDIEWCHRMRDHGWSVLLEPAATVTHYLGTSAGQGPATAAAYRQSFERYCDLYGLWGLRLAGRIGVALRGGRA